MNIYIWEDIENVSRSYHSGGGMAVVASTEERAREMIMEHWKKLQEDEIKLWKEMGEPSWYSFRVNLDEKMPKVDHAYKLADNFAEEKLIIFPDTGCC